MTSFDYSQDGSLRGTGDDNISGEWEYYYEDESRGSDYDSFVGDESFSKEEDDSFRRFTSWQSGISSREVSVDQAQHHQRMQTHGLLIHQMILYLLKPSISIKI